MLVCGTVVADANTVVRDGAVVVDGDRITAVGDRAALSDAYPDHDRREFDLVTPGFVNAHVHTVQTLGRGLADDATLLDWLDDAVLPMEAAMDAEVMRTAATLGYLELAAAGSTTAVDHLSVHHAAEAFEAARDVGVRARLGKAIADQSRHPGLREDVDTAIRETRRLADAYHDPTGRLRYAVTPRFALGCSEPCLRACRSVADDYENVRIHTHAAETRDSARAVLDETGRRPVEFLDDVGLTGEDVLLAHGVWTDEAERDLLAETGTHLAYCPSSNMKLASGVAPVPDYRERGVNVALGNDGPPCNNALDVLTELRQAVLLQRVDALDAGALDARAAFEMATVNGARAAGFDRLGRLSEGWRADVVGLTTGDARSTPVRDPVSHLVYSAHGDDVAFTMVAGDVVYDAGEHVGVDATRVRERAEELAASL